MSWNVRGVGAAVLGWVYGVEPPEKKAPTGTYTVQVFTEEGPEDEWLIVGPLRNGAIFSPAPSEEPSDGEPPQPLAAAVVAEPPEPIGGEPPQPPHQKMDLKFFRGVQLTGSQPPEKAVQLKNLETFCNMLSEGSVFLIQKGQDTEFQMAHAAARADGAEGMQTLLQEILAIIPDESWKLCQPWLCPDIRSNAETRFLTEYDAKDKKTADIKEWMFSVKLIAVEKESPNLVTRLYKNGEKPFLCKFRLGGTEIEKCGFAPPKAK